ncbi:MAG: FHA domain-containing protein [Candidatus Binataceae bacterium]
MLKRKITVGNAGDNDVIVSDPTVSRHHAILKRRFRRYRLIDLESTNGTFINGRSVNGPTRIARGDELRFGAARWVFLESPTTRDLRKRISPKIALALLLVIFASGFAVTQHFINLSLSRKLAAASSSESAAVAGLQQGRGEAIATLEKERAEESQPLWVRRVNYYRSLAKLSPIIEDSTLSHADFLHSRYLVKYEIRTGSLPFAHTEDPNAPYYTPAGLKAAENSDVAERDNVLVSGVQAVDDWVKGPFHRLAILNPEVLKAGLGSYTQSGFEAIGLYLPSPPSPAHPYGKPVEFPPPDSTIPLAIYEAGEWPDPLTSCPGYVAPTGLPVTLQLGAWIPVQVTAHSFTHDGTALEQCAFDAATYTNPGQATQNWARQGLKGSGAVILIPRAPLTSGERYSVSITAAGHTYAWSFAVGD